MGRPKQYDRIELLDQAIDLFRRQGFHGTSTAQLVEELGINRKSMYAEFGSKQGLFEAVLERYDGYHLTRVIGRLEGDDAGLHSIHSAFAGYARASRGWARGRGCLLCNTAVERGALEAGALPYVDAYFERVTAGFHNALSRARDRGELIDSADLDRLAAFFMMNLIGVAACVRAEAPPEQVEAAVDIVHQMLDGLQA